MSTVTERQQDEETRRRRREALLALLLAALIVSTDDDLQAAARGWADGKVNPSQFGALLMVALPDAHAHAAYVGRQWSGNLAPFGAADRAFGANVAQAQRPFVEAFVADLWAGKLSDAQAAARASLYAHRLYGTAQEAWLANIPADAMLWWETDPLAAHCSTGVYGSCPDLAARSPMRADEWPTEPGAGDTECLARCRCWFRWENGTGPRVAEN